MTIAKCKVCNGTGYVPSEFQVGPDEWDVSHVECNVCSGIGEVITSTKTIYINAENYDLMREMLMDMQYKGKYKDYKIAKMKVPKTKEEEKKITRFDVLDMDG